METRQGRRRIVREGGQGRATATRVLDNDHLQPAQYQARWRTLEGDQRLRVIVDATKLSDDLSIMRVGLAYKRRCLPRAGRCCAPTAWPEGQVERSTGRLQQVKKTWPAEGLVSADRGIGPSAAFVRAVTHTRQWHSLFRVQGLPHFQANQQPAMPWRALTRRGGKGYRARGHVFKSAGWRAAQVRVIWDAAYDEPWCLISDLPSLSGPEDAKRNWQEQAFRDRKGAGWHCHNSPVWQDDPADSFRLVLALAVALTRSPVLPRRRQPYPWFRRGLPLISAFKPLTAPLLFCLVFRPPLPLALVKMCLPPSLNSRRGTRWQGLASGSLSLRPKRSDVGERAGVRGPPRKSLLDANGQIPAR